MTNPMDFFVRIANAQSPEAADAIIAEAAEAGVNLGDLLALAANIESYIGAVPRD